LDSSLANKQDRREALGKNEILEHLQIKQILNDNRTLCRLVKKIEFVSKGKDF
jgi:hypothetical protein